MRKLQRILAITAIGFLAAATGCTPDSATAPQAAPELDGYQETVLESEAFREAAPMLEALEAMESEELQGIEALQQGPGLRQDEGAFIFFVIGDSELNMRGNTYPQLENWIERINAIGSYGLEFPSGDFEEGESRLITKPELVFLAGDINKDRAFGFSLPGDLNQVTKQETNRLFNQLDEDILFFAGNGNHDWDPYQFGDNSYGHNLGGLLSNLGTAQFVRSRYYRGLQDTEEISDASFNYDRGAGFFQPTTSAEFNYSFEYRGFRFTQLNQFLYQPAAMVSFESFFNTGPAWYFETNSGQWFADRCAESAADGTPHVVVQHFPVNTGDGWWDDDLGGTPDGLRQAYMDIFATSHEPVMFTGHNHSRRNTTVQPYGITDHTAGYFADGWVTAVKASAERGIQAVAHIRLSVPEVLDIPAPVDYSIPQ